MATLRPQDSDRILAAIRPHLPDGVVIDRRRARVLRVRYRPQRFEWHTARSAPFAHIRRTQSPAGRLATGLRQALRAITADLRNFDLRWPGLAWGLIAVDAEVDGDFAVATHTDVNGHQLTVGPINTADGGN